MSYVNHSRTEMQSVGQNNKSAFREVCGAPTARCVHFTGVGADLILKNIHLLVIEEQECYK